MDDHRRSIDGFELHLPSMVFLLTCLPFSCLCDQIAIFIYLLLPSRSWVGDRAERKTLHKALVTKRVTQYTEPCFEVGDQDRATLI